MDAPHESSLPDPARDPQLLLDTAGAALFTVDVRGRFSYANPACLDLLGYGDERELIGREVHPLIHHTRPDGSTHPRAECPFLVAVRDGTPVRLEGELMWRADGSSFYADCDARPIERDGTLRGALVTLSDVSQRKRREDELRFLMEASELLASSLDYEETLAQVGRLAVPGLADWYRVDLLEDDGLLHPAAIAHRDQSRIASAQEMRRRFPPRPQDHGSIYTVLQTGQPRLTPYISDAMLHDYAQSDEHLRLLRRLGLSSLMRVPLSARGRAFGVITLVSAEAERHFGESDLAVANELARRVAMAIDNARLYHEAQRAVQMRDDVLAIVSHDLKSPLSSINMSASLMLRQDRPPKERKLLTNVQRACRRMAKLLDDLLDLASIGTGKLRIEREETAIEPLLAEAVETMGPLAAQKAITLTADCRLPRGLTLRCDRSRLLQVLENLIGNAIKFSDDETRVDIDATYEEQMLVVSIADQGPGIDPDDLPHLFDPYWSGGQHRRIGSGLGLFISKGIVEAHGGTIEAENRPGGGSCFRFRIPSAPS